MIESSSAKEEIKDEISELEADQHPNFFRDEPRGRKRMAVLLEELNAIEKKGVRPNSST